MIEGAATVDRILTILRASAEPTRLRLLALLAARALHAGAVAEGPLLAGLQFSSAQDVFDAGLHDYIDGLQTKLNAIGEALFQVYIFQPFHLPGEDDLRQQEEQQQQSAMADGCWPEHPRRVERPRSP